jgi:hypothetical protein
MLHCTHFIEVSLIITSIIIVALTYSISMMRVKVRMHRKEKKDVICICYFYLPTCSSLLLFFSNLDNSKPQFLLTNLIKDGSICPQSLSSSYIGECANDYQFRLHLSPCSSSHQTLDLQLLCVGTWIEGFNTYFVTRILSKHFHHQYACFVRLLNIRFLLPNTLILLVFCH